MPKAQPLPTVPPQHHPPKRPHLGNAKVGVLGGGQLDHGPVDNQVPEAGAGVGVEEASVGGDGAVLGPRRVRGPDPGRVAAAAVFRLEDGKVVDRVTEDRQVAALGHVVPVVDDRLQPQVGQVGIGPKVGHRVPPMSRNLRDRVVRVCVCVCV